MSEVREPIAEVSVDDQQTPLNTDSDDEAADLVEVTDPNDPGMYLGNMLYEAINKLGHGPLWLADHAVDPVTGEKVFAHRSAAHGLLTKPRRLFLRPDMYRALSALLRIPIPVLIEASAISLGCWPAQTHTFATLLPRGVDSLPTSVQLRFRDLLVATVDALEPGPTET